jgi:hypothetical protein
LAGRNEPAVEINTVNRIALFPLLKPLVQLSDPTTDKTFRKMGTKSLDR